MHVRRRQNILSSLGKPTEKLRVLVVGRFQPIHNGHISLIEQALELGDVVIVVGSAQKSKSIDNPFTCRERIEMIQEVISEQKWDASQFTVIPVEDVHSNEIWTSKVEMLTPTFHTVMTGNKLVGHLFEKRGYVIIQPKLFNPSKFKGTLIRKKYIKNKKIENLVPTSVAKYLKSLDLNFLSQKN